jgi:hypothetical protein
MMRIREKDEEPVKQWALIIMPLTRGRGKSSETNKTDASK